MTEEMKTAKAKEVYESVCSMLDSHDLRYERHDEDLVITFNMSGEDIPMQFLYVVNPKAMVVSLLSPLPFDITEDNRVNLAVAVNVINNKLINGCFDYDITDGNIKFRIVSAFRGNTQLDEEVFYYMLAVAAGTVDEYNDRFMALSKGMIDLEKFIQMENNDD